jgi:hypothetical protein
MPCSSEARAGAPETLAAKRLESDPVSALKFEDFARFIRACD